MIEVTNITKSPVQILIKSKKGAFIKETGKLVDTNYAFKSYNIPGLGSGKNVIILTDEQKTIYIDKLVKEKLIKIRTINDIKISK